MAHVVVREFRPGDGVPIARMMRENGLAGTSKATAATGGVGDELDSIARISARRV